MAFKVRSMRHDEGVRYTVIVLWLIGYRDSSIADLVHLRRRQVTGIVDGFPDFRNRAGMTDAERRANLSNLLAIRFDDGGVPLDRGRLDGTVLAIRPLASRQKRKPVPRRA